MFSCSRWESARVLRRSRTSSAEECLFETPGSFTHPGSNASSFIPASLFHHSSLVHSGAVFSGQRKLIRVSRWSLMRLVNCWVWVRVCSTDCIRLNKQSVALMIWCQQERSFWISALLRPICKATLHSTLCSSCISVVLFPKQNPMRLNSNGITAQGCWASSFAVFYYVVETLFSHNSAYPSPYDAF